MTTPAQQERVRVKGILTCPEAVGRSDAANVIAFGTGLEVAAARRLLASMPTDKGLTKSADAFWADVRAEIKA